jgi:hypothetical protein
VEARFVAGGVALLLAQCPGGEARTELFVSASGRRVEAPEDQGALCLDLTSARVCWGSTEQPTRCGAPLCVTSRPTSASVAPAAGYRCAGQASMRRCESRAQHAGPFVCTGTHCVQRLFRRPDNAEWDCVELSGVLLCHELVSAAGIANGPADPGFLCGQRRGHRERVCVDYAPDPPPLAAWSCSIRQEQGAAARVCHADTKPRIGSGCSAATECPAGASCASSMCVPARPVPGCWFDLDCGGEGPCRFGSCVSAAPAEVHRKIDGG